MQSYIMIIEDEPDISGLLVKILQEAGYRTCQAFSGTEAELLLEKSVPDLILLDGGKGHVAAVQPLLEEMGIEVPLFGMVKDDRHRTRAIAQGGGEIAISSYRRAYTLVSSIQDEVHRFAIGYHRQQRKKSAISSTLTSIPGIGEARAKALLKHFKTVTAVSEADLAELEGAPGMTRPAARRVWEHFHPEAAGLEEGL